MDELMIKAENVSKEYKLGQLGGTTLRDELQRIMAKIRHKEDPTRKLGSAKYSYGEKFMALDDVNFEVKKGECIGIIGHNGAGKSTLLKLISRVTAPSKGEIGLNGRIASMLEVGTGFHAELTGRENIYINGAILGMTKKEIDEKIEKIIDFSECRKFIDTPVKRYSSGMYVKLAFSVAAHLDSEIMIMDEVLAVGDAAFQEKCIKKMVEISESESRTILYVSHNMSTIRQLCNRCLVLDKGHLIFDGNVDEAIEIYLARNSEMLNKYDLSLYTQGAIESKKVQLTQLEFVDKKIPVYYNNEKLKLRLTWKAYDDYEKISFRLIICNRLRNPIGMAEFNNYSSAKKNEIYTDDFEIDISNLPEGDYSFYVVMYDLVTNGSNVVLDGPAIYMPFKSENSNKEGLTWDYRCWGHVRFVGSVEPSVLKENF